jgi:hypothetical protein
MPDEKYTVLFYGFFLRYEFQHLTQQHAKTT